MILFSLEKFGFAIKIVFIFSLKFVYAACVKSFGSYINFFILFFFRISLVVSIKFEDSITSHFFAYCFASVVYLASVIKYFSSFKFKKITLSQENLHSKYIAFSEQNAYNNCSKFFGGMQNVYYYKRLTSYGSFGKRSADGSIFQRYRNALFKLCFGY